MDDIIVSIETLLGEFQVKFKELEEIVYNTNQQFNRLKVEYVKSVPIAKGSVMSMKDFVSYMSTLEDDENEETSQNISELPFDNDNKEVIKPDVEGSILNQMNLENNKTSLKRKSSRRSQTFSKHHVIHEEAESDATYGSEFEETAFPQPKKIEIAKSRPASLAKSTPKQTLKSESHTLPYNQNTSSKLSNKKPTNLDIVKVRVKPDLKTLPVKQHPEPAIVASPAPSPMTPTEDKIPKLENEKSKLDKINNNPTIPERKPGTDQAVDQATQQNKLHCKEGKLPAPKNPKTVVLSPTPSPRIPTISGIPCPTPRNLTKTICTQPNAEILKCKKCGRVRCVQPAHKHNTRSKVKTLPEEWNSAND
eukprot:TRINITY_DN52647_c0_g1_i1.p1 TRINITY_DN52647_c0_g1~~TRINITY_DN52647_c0_g1_i1.p1  ORF type:complete len:364 (-),score=84.78 TRINITY_DN52647_c0_g1_i1:47-1138(-)